MLVTPAVVLALEADGLFGFYLTGMYAAAERSTLTYYGGTVIDAAPAAIMARRYATQALARERRTALDCGHWPPAKISRASRSA